MNTRVLDVLSSQLTEQIEDLKNFLSDGKAKDFAEYREYCGKLRGLLVAVGMTKDLVRNLEQSDE